MQTLKEKCQPYCGKNRIDRETELFQQFSRWKIDTERANQLFTLKSQKIHYNHNWFSQKTLK